MRFGDTEVKATAVDIRTMQEVHVNIDFLSTRQVFPAKIASFRSHLIIKEFEHNLRQLIVAVTELHSRFKIILYLKNKMV